MSRNSRQKVMHEDLMDQVVAEPNLARARAAVKRNRGAAGIDRMTVNELEVHWRRHGAKMRAKLVAGRWTPSPVRRVEIPKPNGGRRPLGIPTVMDRVVQQALLQVLQPIFDPRFSESSYGFRPRRSAHDAVRGGGEAGAGRDRGLDREASAFASEPCQERGREALGAEVSGVSHQPPRAARSSAAKCAAMQAEGTRDLAQLP